MHFAAILDSSISFFPGELKVAPTGRLDIISFPFQLSARPRLAGKSAGVAQW
jgi:hypothetical protein